MKNKNIFRSNFNLFYIFALVARSYFTNATVFVSNIILPFTIYFILSLILENNVRVGLAIGIAISAVMSTGVLSFAVNFFEWRNSVIYKKVKISLVSEFQFYLAFFLFYLIISFVMFWFLIGFVLFYERMKYLLDNKEIEFVIKQIKSITNTNWMWIFIGLFQLSLVAILIGLLIGLLVTTAASAQAIGLAFYLTAAFITSCYLSLSISAKVEFLRDYGNIFPVYPSIHSIQTAWLENLIPDDYSIEELIAKTEKSGFHFRELQKRPYPFDANFPEANKVTLTINFEGSSTSPPETLIYDFPADKVDLKWTKATDEGFWFLNPIERSGRHPFIRLEYIKFSILGSYWGHALTSLGWTTALIIAIAIVNKFKYNRR